ncbi:MAG TPA: hypothetical protein VF529_17905 [Solirubrobacteraceae bacterium]|jgi:hypothetical protein
MSEFEAAARRNEEAARRTAAANAASVAADQEKASREYREKQAHETVKREQRARLERATQEFLTAAAKLGARGGDWRRRWPGSDRWQVHSDIYLSPGGTWQRYSSGSSYDGSGAGFHDIDPLAMAKSDSLASFVEDTIERLAVLFGELRVTVGDAAGGRPTGDQGALAQIKLWDEASAFAARNKAQAVRADDTVIITRKSLFGDKLWRARLGPTGRVEIKRQ